MQIRTFGCDAPTTGELVKNRRVLAFQEAIDTLPASVERWSDLAQDPNAPSAIAFRARTLRNAWRDEIPDRAEFLVERARGRRVLDVGCVAHDLERMKSPEWLQSNSQDLWIGVSRDLLLTS